MKTNSFSWQNKIRSSVIQGDTFLLPLGFVGVTIYGVFMLGHLTCVENRVCNSLKVIQMCMIHRCGLISEYIIIITVFFKNIQFVFCQCNIFCHQYTQNTTTNFVRFTQIVKKFKKQILKFV